MKCQNCKTELKKGIKFCPDCGLEVKDPETEKGDKALNYCIG